MSILKPLLILLIGLFGCGSQSGTYEEPFQQNNQAAQKSLKAPEFTLSDLQGKPFSLSDFKGKVVFLDFWATWCPPCVVSTPEIEKMGHHYKDKDVVIISVSLDESVEAVHSFVKNMKMTNLVTMAGNSQIDLKYRVTGLPSFFLINQKGYVVGSWNGYHPSLVKQWRNEIDDLLKI